jgi:hypothetical protein
MQERGQYTSDSNISPSQPKQKRIRTISAKGNWRPKSPQTY